jgi:hypothetical protein
VYFRRRKARLTAAAAGLGLAVAGLTVAPPAAFANTPCPNGSICFYKDSNGGGAISVQAGLLVGNQNWIVNFQNSHYRDGSTLNDSVSSIINASAECLWVFPDAGFKPQGVGYLIAPHSGVNAGLAFPNDSISSALAIATNPGC